MANDYYSHFQELLGDTGIDDLLKATMGYQESSDGIAAVNEWMNRNAKSDANLNEFEDTFNCCLEADEALWFNLGWRLGWVKGVVEGLKANGLDNPDSTSLVGSISSLLGGSTKST